MHFFCYGTLRINEQTDKGGDTHCVKIVQTGSFLWSVLYRIQSEYGKIRTRKKLCLWTLLHSESSAVSRSIRKCIDSRLSKTSPN